MRWLVLPVAAAAGFAAPYLLARAALSLPETPAGYLILGDVELRKGSLPAIERAMAEVERASSLAPGHPKVAVAIAAVELARAEALSWNAARAPEGPSRAELLTKADQATERAFVSARSAVESGAALPAASRALAEYYLLKGERAKAEQWRDVAARGEPEHPDLAYIDALLAAETDPKAALTPLDALLAREPDRQRARLLAAALHWAGGDTERSRTLALEITAAVPDHARAAWYVDARPKSAKKEAPSAGDEDAGGGDGDFAALLAGASKLRNRGRTKKALEAYDRALELQPENIRASLGKAWCLFDLERTAEALELFFAVVEAKPRMAPAIIGLAQALEAAGRARDARVYYERYLELEPAGPDAPVARAALERAAGE